MKGYPSKKTIKKYGCISKSNYNKLSAGEKAVCSDTRRRLGKTVWSTTAKPSQKKVTRRGTTPKPYGVVAIEIPLPITKHKRK